MAETGDTNTRNLKIKYFAGGLMIGGVLGLFFGNPILGSCIGMAAGVTLGNNSLQNEQ